MEIEGVDYIFLIVGVRAGKFLPDLGHKLTKSFVTNICDIVINFSEDKKPVIAKDKNMNGSKNVFNNYGTMQQVTVADSAIQRNEFNMKDVVVKINDEIKDILEKENANTDEEKVSVIDGKINSDTKKEIIDLLKSGVDLIPEVITSPYSTILSKLFDMWKSIA